MSAVEMDAPAAVEPRLCRDCKHCIVPAEGHLSDARCRLSVWTSLITGDQQYDFCGHARSWGACGPDGTEFEARS